MQIIACDTCRLAVYNTPQKVGNDSLSPYIRISLTKRKGYRKKENSGDWNLKSDGFIAWI